MKRNFQLAYIFFVFIMIVVAAFFYIKFFNLNISTVSGKDFTEMGTFGDSWGMFTSIFSALGFGGILITLYLQYTSLKETQNDAEIQKKSLALQQFEDVFFRMLTIHNEIIKDLDLRKSESKSPISTGRDTFQLFYNSLKKKYEEVKYNIEDNYANDAYCDFIAHYSLKCKENLCYHDERAAVGFSFEIFWSDYRSDLGHYFRFLFNIYKFIDKEKSIPDDVKYTYARILRAQLSDYELIILFYNCLSYYGVRRFKPLAEKYKLFNNLPFALVLNEKHLSYYEDSAFGDKLIGNVMMIKELSNKWVSRNEWSEGSKNINF